MNNDPQAGRRNLLRHVRSLHKLQVIWTCVKLAASWITYGDIWFEEIRLIPCHFARCSKNTVHAGVTFLPLFRCCYKGIDGHFKNRNLCMKVP